MVRNIGESRISENSLLSKLNWLNSKLTQDTLFNYLKQRSMTQNVSSRVTLDHNTFCNVSVLGLYLLLPLNQEKTLQSILCCRTHPRYKHTLANTTENVCYLHNVEVKHSLHIRTFPGSRPDKQLLGTRLMNNFDNFLKRVVRLDPNDNNSQLIKFTTIETDSTSWCVNTLY